MTMPLRRARPYVFWGQTTLAVRDLSDAGAGQDRDPRQPSLVREALRAPRRAFDADLKRCRLLEALQGLHQARRQAAVAAEPYRVRLPLRLRPVSRSRAAFVPGADRDQRALQP